MRDTMRTVTLLLAGAALLPPGPAAAEIVVQCPGDLDGDAIPDPVDGDGLPNPAFDPNVRCFHLGAGDGFARMADGKVLYTFGFSDLTGVSPEMAMMAGMLASETPAPTIAVDEGNEVYLTLSNVGMMLRPDLFDPHTVHWHGFPNASSLFDGVPDASISINMGSSLTYYYQVHDPGTYMYHCHVEATEHMQMGMLGNLYVRAAQDQLPPGTDLQGFPHQAGTRYAYNDGDGSTRYDVEVPLQLGSFDGNFHDLHLAVQPLPFADMRDNYPMINGRGYPDTLDAAPLEAPDENGGIESQRVGSRITAAAGDRILLRLSNLNITRYYTVSVTGIPMTVVGTGARPLQSPTAGNLYYETSSVTLGGGEARDVILDTEGIAPGTYLLYTTNLNYLSNDREDFGGMMTEIVIE